MYSAIPAVDPTGPLKRLRRRPRDVGADVPERRADYPSKSDAACHPYAARSRTTTLRHCASRAKARRFDWRRCRTYKAEHDRTPKHQGDRVPVQEEQDRLDSKAGHHPRGRTRSKVVDEVTRQGTSSSPRARACLPPRRPRSTRTVVVTSPVARRTEPRSQRKLVVIAQT